MKTAFDILLWVGVAVAVVFTFLVFVTGKGDAMSGGGGIRTTFKGKASIEDLIGRLTLGMGILFMVLMVVLDVIATQAFKPGALPN